MSGFTKIRPWLAALLGLAVTGLGHLYLRRWRRAILWVALAFSVSLIFVPTGALESLATGGQIPPITDVLPILAVSLVSVADAFLLGMKQVGETRRQTAVEDSDTVSCPDCGRETDPELDFCHWCTTRLDEPRDD